MERIHAKRSGNKVNSSTPHWVRDRLDSKQPPRGHGLARMRPPRAWCVGGPRRPRGRGPPTAAESARAAPAPARVAAREVPFAAELKGAPIAARRPRRRTSLSCPGQRGGRGGLVTCGQAAPGDGGWVEPKAPRSAEHRGVGGPRVQRAGSCCLIDNVVHWTPSLPQV